MKKLQRLFTVLLVAGTASLASVVGFNLYPNASVRADTAAGNPNLTQHQVQTLTDVSAAFKAVAGQISPSVVNIRVTKTIKAPRALRHFFRDFRNDQDRNGKDQDQNKDNDILPNIPDLPGLPPGLFDDGGSMKEIGTGSGVIIETGNGVGYILTNNHVAGGASEMDITLADGRHIKDGKVLGTDPNTDLAVVQVKADHLALAKWGNSDELQQGDWVLAFGSPFGYVGSMTHGIVSALHRQAGILGQYGYENFIQVDAPINPGNSGGPLVNLHGEVVGINTAIATESGGFQGIGFAIPSAQARPIYETLKSKGRVVRGWLGVEIIDVAKAANESKASGYKGDQGVLVKGVLRDTPATGKLQPGDVITALNGQSVRDSQELRSAVAGIAPGTEAKLEVYRDGKKDEVAVKLGEQPGNPVMASSRGNPQGEGADKIGIQLTDLTSSLATKYGVNVKTGAAITAIEPRSIASQAGLHVGDVITRVGSKEVHNAKEATDALHGIDLKKGARLFIANREGSEYVFLQSET